jgi:hypothetical protein
MFDQDQIDDNCRARSFNAADLICSPVSRTCGADLHVAVYALGHRRIRTDFAYDYLGSNLIALISERQRSEKVRAQRAAWRGFCSDGPRLPSRNALRGFELRRRESRVDLLNSC